MESSIANMHIAARVTIARVLDGHLLLEISWRRFNKKYSPLQD